MIQYQRILVKDIIIFRLGEILLKEAKCLHTAHVEHLMRQLHKHEKDAADLMIKGKLCVYSQRDLNHLF